MQLVIREKSEEIREIIDSNDSDVVIKNSKGDKTLLTVIYEESNINIIGDDTYNSILLNNIVLKEQQREIVILGLDSLVVSGINGQVEILFLKDEHSDYSLKDVKLPFVIPEYTTYPKYTAIMSILAANNKDKIWIYNNFILLWADLWVGEPEYWNDFKFSNELIQSEFCPVINKKKLKDDYFNEENFLEKIKSDIQQGKYLCLSLDMHDIDEWWTLKMEREHYTHQTTFYGFNDEKELFYVADFFRKKYKMITLPYTLVQKAYFNGKKIKSNMVRRYVPDEMFCFNNIEYDVDLSKIKELVNNFVNSKDETYYDFVNIYKRGNVVYGFNYLERIFIHLKDCYYNHFIFDMRPFELIHEMNAIMVDRIQYLIDEKNIIVLSENKEDFEVTTNASSIIVSLAVKFKISRNKKILKRMIDKYQDFLKKEKNAFIKLSMNLGNKIDGNTETDKETYGEFDTNKISYESLLREYNEKISNILYAYEIEEIISLQEQKAVKNVFSDNYWKNVFPFEKERAGKMLNGNIIDAEKVGNGIQAYYFDERDRIILNKIYENEYTGYDTLVRYLYFYEDNITYKITVFENKENDCLEVGNCWVLRNNKDVPYQEIYYGKNGIRNITEYIFNNKVLINTKVISYDFSKRNVEGNIPFSQWEEKYYYKNNKIKQIINDKDGIIENVYPMYGVPEYDNYYIKQLITNKIKNIASTIFIDNKKITVIYGGWNIENQTLVIEMKYGTDKYIDEILLYENYIADNETEILIPEIVREIIYEMISNNELPIEDEITLCVKSSTVKKTDIIISDK